MVRLREIPRTSTFAWSPGTHSPIIATGTVAGAVDADFSNTTRLELWNLELQSGQVGLELSPKAVVNTDARFFDIAWGGNFSEKPTGIIAGALESGALDLWSADALLNGSGEALISSTTKHTGAIKSLQFNPFKSELLLTAGAKGEIYVWDLHNIENPFSLGSRASRADDIESVDWNKKIPHILVTGGTGGLVTVWDVKTKRESLTLNNLGRRAVSAVAWHPENATKLITAIPDDTNPVVLVWDLRNSNAPERTLAGHESGVLSVSWCKHDPDLLLSSGKDNRTICWNPQTGEKLGEFPLVTNWTFQTRWNPRNPNLLATASFDGKIGVHTIQTTKADATRPDATSAALEGEDFFNQASIDPQGPSFSLKQPPRWLKCPVGASFGFGGKLIHFSPLEPQPGQQQKSKVTISRFEAETGISSAAETFEQALKSGDMTDLIESRAKEAKTEVEKEEWNILLRLLDKNPRTKLREYFGFSDEGTDAEQNAEDATDSPAGIQANGSAQDKRLSSFFTDTNADSELFLSDLASIPSTRGAKTNNPFHIFSGDESETDRQITRALVLGQFEKAVDICLKQDRLLDAFMLAICGGEECTEKVRIAYFTKNAKGPNYLRVLASVIGKNMWDVVHNADLSNWKEVMVTLCTFASDEDFTDLCEVLGDRLDDEYKHNKNDAELRKGASFCYLAGSKLGKVVNIWIEQLNESEATDMETAVADSTFSIHVRSLQHFIEKVTIFREATKFQDKEQDQPGNWKLTKLYEKYCEYADIVAANGYLDVAEKYLNLLPLQYPAAMTARSRVREAIRKGNSVAAQSQSRQSQSSIRQPATTALPGPAYPAKTPFQTAKPQQAMQSNIYAPPTTGILPPSNNPAPTLVTQNYNPYQPQQAIPPSPTTYGGTSQLYTPALGQAPPRQFSPPVSAIPPPSKVHNIGNWNDTPIVTNLSRRGTPGGPPQGLITSPFPGALNAPSPPPSNAPYGAPPPTGPPQRASLPPPPKGAAPPQRVNSPHQFNMQSSVATSYSSGAPSQYPPPPSAVTSPPIYNPPPSAGPPTGRYAPAAPPAGQPQPPQNRQSLPPLPPQGTSVHAARPGPGPLPNQYAPPPVPSQFTSQYSPQQQHHSTGPYGPPSNVAHTAPPVQQAEVVPPPKPQTPAPKHPRGDRTHIPDKYKPIYELLSADLSRVKAVAPPSHKRVVQDVEKRLNILFDHLNNEEILSSDSLDSMLTLATAIASKDYQTAHNTHLDLITHKTEECTNWMTGVKRLIDMSKVTP